MNFLGCGGFALGNPVNSHVNGNTHKHAFQMIYVFLQKYMLLLRTAIYMILCLLPFGLVLMGPDCSSWTAISRGTSLRTVLNPWGSLQLEWVRCANLTISRLLEGTIKCQVWLNWFCLCGKLSTKMPASANCLVISSWYRIYLVMIDICKLQRDISYINESGW